MARHKCFLTLMIVTVMSANIFLSTGSYVSANANVISGDLVTPEGEFIFEDTEHMSNEVFFGKWNVISNSWDIKPKINYEFNGYNSVASEKLTSVGEAVKVNDYDRAKQLILDYYRYINNILPHSYSGDGSNQNLAKCELYANNFIYDYMSGATIVDVVDVNQSWTDVEVDVTSHVNETKTSGITIDLFDLIKDNAKIEIMSREGAANGQGFIPYIEIVMNGGIKKTYQTDCDTYVVAGNQKTSIHGTEERLYCEESITSKWNTGALIEPIAERTAQSDVPPVDEMTKRTKIAFKFDCAESDQIESATLHLYARNCVADANDGGDIPTSSELAVFRQASTSWTEANCHYQSVQGYYYSWSGEDWIQWKYLKEGSYRFNEDHFRFVVVEQPLQKAYEATGNENYAYHYFRYIMSQLYAFGSNPGAYKSLDNACRLQAFPVSLRKMLNSKYMTPTIMANCLKYLWLQMDYQNSKPANTNNWGATEMSGLYICGINFKEFIPKEGNTPYMQYAVEQLGRTANNTLLDKGGSNELSLGYTMYAISGLLSPWGVAQDNGITNPDEAGYTEEYRDILRGLARYYCMMSAPGPQTNGHADEHRGNWENTALDRIGKMTNDDELMFFATKGASGKMPEITSLYYEDNKNGVMRTGWGKQDLYAHFNADGAKGSHGQADDLALIIYGYGQCLLSDIEYTSSADGYGEWMTSAKGHNTVTVDNENQILYKQTGEINDWETNAKYDFVKMSTNNYTNAVADRKVLFIKPGFWIVTDHILPNDMTVEHRYDQRWHMMKDSHATYNESNFVVKSNYDSGANITIVPIDTGSIKYNPSVGATVDVNNDGKIDYMDIDVLQSDDYDTILKHGYIVTKDNAAAYQDNIYAAYTRKSQGATSFSTILYPTRPGEDVTITANTISTNVSSADAQAFSAIIDDGKVNGSKSIVYYALNNDLKKQLRQVGNYETDGSLLYTEKDYSGKHSNIILKDTSVIKADNEFVFKTKDGYVSDLAIEFSNSEARIYSSDAIDLNNITFLTDNNIRTVYLNNATVGFKKSGNYIYFGENPIVEGQQNNTQNTPQNYNSNTGNDYGSGAVIEGNVTTSGGVTDKLPSIQLGMTKPISEPYEKYIGEISGHWAEDEIKYLLNNGIIQGDGTSLMLDSNVTRAEFATMIAKVMGIESSNEESLFDDVNEGDWFRNSVSSLASAGIVTGDNKNFYPQNNIKREEMARILVLAYEYFNKETKITDSDFSFDDWKDVSDWALSSIEKAVSLKLLFGDDNNCLRPRDTARRDEAMAVVYRLLKGVKINDN